MSANKGTHFSLGLFLTLDQLLVQLALVGLVSCCGGPLGDVLAPSHLLLGHLPCLVLHGVGVLVAAPPVPRCPGLPTCCAAAGWHHHQLLPCSQVFFATYCHPLSMVLGGVLVSSSAALLPGVTGPPTYYHPQCRLKCGGCSHL